MIKIIAGVYGHKEGAIVKPKTVNDAPFALSPEEEKRLVDLGVAEYVGDTRSVIPKQWRSIPDYSVDMDVKTLRSIASEVGLTFKNRTSKAEMIEALDQFFEENMTDGPSSTDDELPAFDPASAVQ